MGDIGGNDLKIRGSLDGNIEKTSKQAGTVCGESDVPLGGNGRLVQDFSSGDGRHTSTNKHGTGSLHTCQALYRKT